MNSRVLEALATGSFLLTDYVRDTEKIFVKLIRILFFITICRDLIEKLKKYLNNLN